MKADIRKVAILGSGVMGSAIAAHFANAGIPSIVLDIVPGALEAGEAAAGLTLADRKVRDRIARNAVQGLLKTTPEPLFVPERIRLIDVGNLDDDLARLAEVDWVIEVVKEDLAIKTSLLAKAAPHVGPHAIVSSNTSGLSLAAMAAGLPERLRGRFLGVHFFNPPRYMKLVELIATSETASDVVAAVDEVCRRRLGKGIVTAKDTPNFIANRIGVHAIMVTLRTMQQLSLTPEDVDALTGPVIGRPKTATFRLADLVGLDTLLHVARNVYDVAKDDESRDVFVPPDVLTRMVAKGLLGRKSGGGFYRKRKGDGPRVLTLDFATLEYREARKASFPELEALKAIEDPVGRLRALISGRGKAAQFTWTILAESLAYASRRLGEIADDVSSVDRAIRWGFGWTWGPFELWDALSFRETYERLRSEGHRLPPWVDALYESGATSFYREGEDGGLSATAKPGVLAKVPVDPRVVNLTILEKAGAVIRKNPGASLLDLGDGVFGLEFHSKMNTLGQDSISMIMTACKEAESAASALVVANHGENFCAGANLMLLLMEAQEGNWDEIDAIVRAFQSATNRLEGCAVPVVMAPHALALGGGCEVVLAGHAIRSAAEAYIGLVEVGAGVVPAGGGCMRLYRNNVAAAADPADVYPALRKTFETIGMAKVSTSAEQARALGFLRSGDGWSMNGDHRIADAKDLALAMARTGFTASPPAREIAVMGRGGIALIDTVLFNMMEGGFISEHDRKIGLELAKILCGGDVPGPTTVSEGHLLDLERESFLRLCGERKSTERMQALLATGKPLRN